MNLIDPLGLEFYGAANAGLFGVNYGTTTLNPARATITVGDGVILGGGLSIGYKFNEGNFPTFGSTLNFGLGKYLGISIAPDLSSVQFNFGLGLALPVSMTVPIENENYEPIDFSFGAWLYDQIHGDPRR